MFRSLVAWRWKLFRSLLDLDSGTACRAVAERTVYDQGGWSLLQFLGASSDTTWYRGPGWQGAWPQWYTGPYALPSVAPCGQRTGSCHTRQWCNPLYDCLCLLRFSDRHAIVALWLDKLNRHQTASNGSLFVCPALFLSFSSSLSDSLAPWGDNTDGSTVKTEASVWSERLKDCRTVWCDLTKAVKLAETWWVHFPAPSVTTNLRMN